VKASRPRIVAAIVRKDLVAFSRDRFYVVVTVVGLVFYVAIFWLLPGSVEEDIRIGVVGPGVGVTIPGQSAGLEAVPYQSEEALAEAVERGEGGVAAGLSFPPDFLEAVAAGREATVRVFLTAGVPDEVRTAVDGLVEELAFLAAGEELPVTTLAQEQVVLGVDRAGEQVPVREKLRPLLAFFVLLMEMLALAALIASEVQERTVTAVLVTPARPSDFLAAKVVAGTLLAFAQAVLLMAAIRSFGRGAGPLLVALLLGALLVTAFGLIAGAQGRDFITVVFWSLLFLIPLAIPAFGALFPGTASRWVTLIPSYGLVEAMVGVTSYGEGWGEAAPHLLSVAGWAAAACAVGVVILQRKVRTL